MLQVRKLLTNDASVQKIEQTIEPAEVAFTGRKTKCGLAFAFCMLANYVEWRMRRALAPMLFEDDLDGRAV